MFLLRQDSFQMATLVLWLGVATTLHDVRGENEPQYFKITNCINPKLVRLFRIYLDYKIVKTHMTTKRFCLISHYSISTLHPLVMRCDMAHAPQLYTTRNDYIADTDYNGSMLNVSFAQQRAGGMGGGRGRGRGFGGRSPRACRVHHNSVCIIVRD